MWHSCVPHSVAEHTRAASPEARDLYHRFVSILRSFGRVTADPKGSGISFQVRARFVFVEFRATAIDARIWLKRRVDHPRFRKVETITARDHVHYLRIERPEELDDEVRGWLAEAYEVGAQRATEGQRRASGAT